MFGFSRCTWVVAELYMFYHVHFGPVDHSLRIMSPETCQLRGSASNIWKACTLTSLNQELFDVDLNLCFYAAIMPSNSNWKARVVLSHTRA